MPDRYQATLPIHRRHPRRAIHHEVVLLLAIGIGVGLFLASDYGNWWDEHLHKVYAQHTIEMYLGQRIPGDTLRNLRHYGPAFQVIWIIARNLITGLVSDLTSADAGHLLYWLAFIPAPLMIYDLALRIASRKAALASALIFATQPLIFGYAFINPKDPPFMTAMIGSVWAGLWASDMLVDRDSNPSLHANRLETSRLPRRLIAKWKAVPRRMKIVMGVLWTAFLLVIVDSLSTQFVFDQLTRLIRLAYDGNAFWPVQGLFDWIAQDAWKTPLSIYLEKARILYLWIRFPFYMVGLTLLAVLSSHVLGSPISLATIWSTRRYWSWGVAAGLLGFCTAIRVVGLFAGIMVGIYALFRARRRALLPLAAYGFLAVLTVYIAWPSLWLSPLKSFSDAIFTMSRFEWQGSVLYEGLVYSSNELPWHYSLQIVLLRLTLPAIVLSSIGMLLAFIDIVNGEARSAFLVLAIAWILVPLSVILLFDVIIYGASRQLMFVYPGLFILSSLAFDRILNVLRRGVWFPIIAGLAIAPGLIGILRLHPYESIYYNELVGGVDGAYRRFHVSAGGTAYREAIEFINQIAPQKSLVLIGTREHHTMTPFARDDLQLPPGSYIVLVHDHSSFPQSEVIYEIERAGVPLSTVIGIPPEDS
jgi:hypothetical protein